MNHWLIKSEPFVYSWSQLEKDKKVMWDGVRNYGARNNLMAMKKGDLAYFYHSNEGLEIVGIASVKKEYYTDPTATEGNWVVVDFEPFQKLKKPISLSQIKGDKKLAGMDLLRLSRLSVQSVKKEEFDYILQLSESK